MKRPTASRRPVRRLRPRGRRAKNLAHWPARENLNLGRPAKLGLVNGTESRWRALLQDLADKNWPVERRRELIGSDAPLRRRVFERADLTDLVGAPVPPIEMRSVKRPAMIGKPRLKIDGVVWSAQTGPMVRRAAEKTQSAIGQVLKGPANVGALVKILRVACEFQSAALEKQCLEARANKFPRQRNARRAGADDTDSRLQYGAGRHRTRVDDHRRSDRRMGSSTLVRAAYIGSGEIDGLERGARPDTDDHCRHGHGSCRLD